jgi:cytidylate kinase
MWKNIGIEKCMSFVESQFHPREDVTLQPSIKPTITISREEGAGGHSVASELVEYMQRRIPSHGVWTVFDRNLVEKILEDHNLHRRVAEYMAEAHSKSLLTDAVEEFLDLHPSSWTLQEKMRTTILHLAKMGNVILVGRGGHVVTSKLKNTFHVRLVGSLEKRIEQIQRIFNLDRKGALHHIKVEDEGRRRYLKDNFDKDINDPLIYHLIINTDWVDFGNAAAIVGEAVIRHFNLDRRLQSAAGQN